MCRAPPTGSSSVQAGRKDLLGAAVNSARAGGRKQPVRPDGCDRCMPLRGDLSTLELVDIVQNLEMHRKSGVLAVETPRGARQLCVENGAVTMIATPGRPTLMEDLVRANLVREADVESARK